MIRSSCLCVLIALLGGCAPKPLAGPGGKCHSLSECKAGLVCFERRCTSDIDELARRSGAPDYATMMGPEPAAPDAGSASDAAGIPVGPGSGDGAAPSDATLDAAPPDSATPVTMGGDL